MNAQQLDYAQKEGIRLRPWVKWACWLGLAAIAVWVFASLPIKKSSRGSVCHICGRVHLHKEWYVYDFHIWTSDPITDPEGTGTEYDKVIGAPHQHDWHLLGFTTKNGGHGVAGDGNSYVPFYALEHVRTLPPKLRGPVYAKIVKNSKNQQDVEVKFETEKAELKSQGVLLP